MTSFIDLPGGLEMKIDNIEAIIEYFRDQAKERSGRRIGFEYERLPVNGDLKAISYSGRCGVEGILRVMAARCGYEIHEEEGRPTFLSRGPSAVTLEPGGQIEFSSPPQPTLSDLSNETAAFISDIEMIAAECEVGFLAAGCHPISRPEEIEWVPKKRYEMMRDYLPARGDLALWMMKATAGCQVSLDFTSEEEAMEILRVSTLAAPIITAIFANSPISEGKPNGYRSFRQEIWERTDPERCGPIPWAIEEDKRFRDYIEWLLDIPLLFVEREGRYMPPRGITLRRWMSEGFDGLPLTLYDLELAMTQVFPTARIKRFIEVRAMDSVPPDEVMAVPALWSALIYSETARRELIELLGGLSYRDLVSMTNEGSKNGLSGEYAGRPMRDWAEAVVSIARREAEDPAILSGLLSRIREGMTPADRVLERFRSLGLGGAYPDNS